jgi:hypothetical protein
MVVAHKAESSSEEDDSDDEDDFNLVDFYELSEDSTEASVTDSTGIPGSKKLPIYNGMVGNCHERVFEWWGPRAPPWR